MTKKIIINFILIFIVFLYSEFLIYSIFKHQQLKKCISTNFNLSQNVPYFKTPHYSDEFFSSNMLRPVANFSNSKTKGNTLLFGCSLAYGANLSNNQTFSYKLAQAEQNKVYNLAYPGWGFQNMLFVLESNKYKLPDKNDKINKVIYVMIDDHFNRLNNFYWSTVFNNIINIRYKPTGNGINKEIKPKFIYLHCLFIVKAFHVIVSNIMASDLLYSYREKQCINIFQESYQLLKKRYEKADFYILEYNTKMKPNTKLSLEKTGWKVLSTKDFVSVNLNEKKYQHIGDFHPTEAAWDIVVKDMIKKSKI